MSIADKLKDKNQGKGFANAPRTNTTAEGGDEMALAMAAQVQGQVNQMVAAANAANLGIEHASDKMADYFTEVLSGRALLNATMTKVQANLEQQGSVTIDADVQPVTLDLPKIDGFQFTRQRFLSAFGGGEKQTELPAAFLKRPEDDNGECDG